jgi:hypothetical protein
MQVLPAIENNLYTYWSRITACTYKFNMSISTLDGYPELVTLTFTISRNWEVLGNPRSLFY